MKTERILEMINNNKIEELKKVLQDEIYANNLKGNPGQKKRYAAMKRFFKYPFGNNDSINYPCKDIEINTSILKGKFNSFVDSRCLALTLESIGEIVSFDTSKNTYLNINGIIDISDYIIEKVDFNIVLAKAKSLGYKYRKSEVEDGIGFEYVLKYSPACSTQDPAYYKIGLFDKSFSIINDGEPCETYYLNRKSPLFIKSSIGLCLILPMNVDSSIEDGRNVIEAIQIECSNKKRRA